MFQYKPLYFKAACSRRSQGNSAVNNLNDEVDFGENNNRETDGTVCSVGHKSVKTQGSAVEQLSGLAATGESLLW